MVWLFQGDQCGRGSLNTPQTVGERNERDEDHPTTIIINCSQLN